MTGIFIGGPLHGETLQVDPSGSPSIRIPLPPRETFCGCMNPDEVPVHSVLADTVDYDCIAVAFDREFALYVLAGTTGRDVVQMLKEWVVTDLHQTQKVNCRSPRSFFNAKKEPMT